MCRNKTTCSKCDQEKELNRTKQAYCLSCHNEYMRENRLKHSELSPEQKKKANARAYLNVYIKRGKQSKQPCEICGCNNVQAHHDDYDKPLEVKWLCSPCHINHHKQTD